MISPSRGGADMGSNDVPVPPDYARSILQNAEMINSASSKKIKEEFYHSK